MRYLACSAGRETSRRPNEKKEKKTSVYRRCILVNFLFLRRYAVAWEQSEESRDALSNRYEK